jgi:hypothetical protein
MRSLLAIGGIFACGGIFAATLVVVLHGLASGQPLHGGDWYAVAIYGGLSAVVLAISLAAWRHDRRARRQSGAGSPLAWIAPVLIVAGLAAGSLVGYWLSSSRVTSLQAIERRDCQRLLGAAPPAKTLAACRPLARSCRWSSRDAPLGSGAEQLAVLERFPKGIRAPISPRARTAILCLIDKLERAQLWRRKP